MGVGGATSTTSMQVVKVGLENPISLELAEILNWKIRNFFEKAVPILHKLVLNLT